VQQQSHMQPHGSSCPARSDLDAALTSDSSRAEQPRSKVPRLESPPCAGPAAGTAATTAATSIQRLDEPGTLSVPPQSSCSPATSPVSCTRIVNLNRSCEPTLYAHLLFVWAFQRSARRLQITHRCRLQHAFPAAACPFVDVVVGLQQRTKLVMRGVLSEALAHKLLCFDRRTAVTRPLPLATSILSRRHVLYRPAGSPMCTLTLRGHGLQPFGRILQRGDNAEVVAVAFHPSLPLLLTGSRDSSAKLWLVNADGTKLKRQVTLKHGSMVNVVSFHPRLPLLLTGGSDRCAKLWRVDLDCAAAAPLATLTGHNHYVISAAFHLRLPLLATSSSDGTAKLWHISPEGSILECALTLNINSHSHMNRVAFHPFFPVLTTGHEMWLFNPEFNAVIATTVLLRPRECVASVAFHPVLPLLATSGNDSSVKLWLVSADGTSATCTATLEGHDFNVMSVAFHACLPLLATASRDSSVKLWAVNADGSAACTATLRGHDLSVDCVAFHPRLPLLVSGSWDGTAKLWR